MGGGQREQCPFDTQDSPTLAGQACPSLHLSVSELGATDRASQRVGDSQPRPGQPEVGSGGIECPQTHESPALWMELGSQLGGQRNLRDPLPQGMLRARTSLSRTPILGPIGPHLLTAESSLSGSQGPGQYPTPEPTSPPCPGRQTHRPHTSKHTADAPPPSKPATPTPAKDSPEESLSHPHHSHHKHYFPIWTVGWSDPPPPYQAAHRGGQLTPKKPDT